MLKKLEILNGELSTKFDPLNARYTVNLRTEETELKLNYDIEKDDKISIFNNEINGENSEVVITVYNDKEMMSYYLEINEPKHNLASIDEDYFSSLELKTDTYMPKYIAPLVAGICFVIILCLFTVLFKKNKKSK